MQARISVAVDVHRRHPRRTARNAPYGPTRYIYSSRVTAGPHHVVEGAGRRLGAGGGAHLGATLVMALDAYLVNGGRAILMSGGERHLGERRSLW